MHIIHKMKIGRCLRFKDPTKFLRFIKNPSLEIHFRVGGMGEIHAHF